MTILTESTPSKMSEAAYQAIQGRLILNTASQKFAQLTIKDAQGIQILYGKEAVNQYFIQFIVTEGEWSEGDGMTDYLGIATGLTTLAQARDLARKISDNFDLPLQKM